MKAKNLFMGAAAALMMCTSVFGADPSLDIIYRDTNPVTYDISKGGNSAESKASESVVLLFVNGDFIYEADPVIQNGTALVPLRVICEKLGASLSWDSSTKTAEIKMDNITVTAASGNSFITTDGNFVSTTAPVQIINSLTYVPLRAVISAFGADVVYNTSAFSSYGPYSSFEVKTIWVQTGTDSPVLSETAASQRAEEIFLEFLYSNRDYIISNYSMDVYNITSDNLSLLNNKFCPGDFVCSLQEDLGEYYYIRFYSGSVWGILIDKYDGSFYPVNSYSLSYLSIGENGSYDSWGLHLQ